MTKSTAIPSNSLWVVLHEVIARKALLRNLVALELKVRYRRSALGLIWTLLRPILYMAVIALVFGKFARGTEKNYALYLLSGLMTWTLLSHCINGSLNCVLRNQTLLRRIYLPKLIFPIVTTISEFINYFFFLIAYFLFASFSDDVILGAGLIGVPAALLMLFLYCAGLSMLFSSLNIFFRDISHMSDIALSLTFYLTPIIYPPSLLGNQALWLKLNPFYYPIMAVRHCLYFPSAAPWDLWAVGFTIGFFIFLLGLGVFVRTERLLIYYM